MENSFLRLNRIEFFVTDACTSKCKHCSVYDSQCIKKSRITSVEAVSAVYKICDEFDIKSVMTFGGEPLLFKNATCNIHSAAKTARVETRQLITNGYFSVNEKKISETASLIVESGINNILISVDAFHDEYVPKDKVHFFANELINLGAENVRLHPAWVVNRENSNTFNQKTEECLQYFSDLGISISSGNNIFLSGRAAKYLWEFYPNKGVDLNTECGTNPYSGLLEDVTSISIGPNGDVSICNFIIGNIYQEDIIEILKRYNPYEHNLMKHIKIGGIPKLIEFAKEIGVEVNLSKFYNTCDICRYVAGRFNFSQ